MRNRARSVHHDDVTVQPQSGSIVGMSNIADPATADPTRGGRRDGRARVKGLWSFTGKYRILHLTWIAFFLSFVVWFNYAPFANTIAEQLGLTEAEKKTIALCNVALTIPARIFIGMALDRWGPRRVYAAILMFAVIPNTSSRCRVR